MFEGINFFSKKNKAEVEESKINDAYGEELMHYSEATKRLKEVETRISHLESQKSNDPTNDLEIDDELKMLNQLTTRLNEKINESPIKNFSELEKINSDIQEVANKLNETTVEFYELNAELNSREKKFLTTKLTPEEQAIDKASYEKLEQNVGTMRIVRNSYEDTLNNLKAKHDAIENKIKQDCLAKKEAEQKSNNIAA